MKNLFVFAILCLQISASLFAQTEMTERRTPIFSFNGNFQVGVPLAAFRDNLDQTGFGGSMLLLANIAQSPISAGLEASILGFERETVNYDVNVGGFNKDYELSTSSNIFLGHAMVRIQAPGRRLINPYLDGMVGFKNLFTSTSLTDEDLGESVNSDTDESDWAFSYGAAAGVQINVSRADFISIDLRCAYLPGNNATYLVRRSDANTNSGDPIEAFEKKNSPTTLLLPQIGITFKFWDRNGGQELPADN